MVRTELGMTMDQLAKRSGVERSHIVRLEAGRVDAQWSTWQRLFRAMRCGVALRVQAKGGLAQLRESQIRLAARAKAGDRPDDLEDWIDRLRTRGTSEIWEPFPEAPRES